MTLRRYTCRTVRDMLPLHVGGDLDPKHVGSVDEHLHGCLSCFREFRDLATMRGRLGVLAEGPLPRGILDGFTEEVMARIAVGEPGPAAELPSRTGRLITLPRVAAAAVLLLAVTVGARSYFADGVVEPEDSIDSPRGSSPVGSTTLVSGGNAAAPRAASRPMLEFDGSVRSVPSPLRAAGLPGERVVSSDGGWNGLRIGTPNGAPVSGSLEIHFMSPDAFENADIVNDLARDRGQMQPVLDQQLVPENRAPRPRGP